MTLTKDPRFKHFASDILRILYLQKLLEYNLKSIQESKFIKSWLKVDANNIISAMNRLRADISDAGKGGSWNIIMDDIHSDRLHDISVLLETVRNITNINDIITTIQEAMTPEHPQNEQK